MLGKTHVAVGVAAALVITGPQTIGEIALAIGAGAAGALISDIDMKMTQTEIQRDVDILFILVAAVIGIALGIEYCSDIKIIERLMQNSRAVEILVGCFIFTGTCVLGKERPHRSFMHSFLAGFLLTFAVGLAVPAARSCFIIGFLSHLALDLLNQKKLRLFYPLKAGVSLRLFRSDGLVNHILFGAGFAVSVLALARLI